MAKIDIIAQNFEIYEGDGLDPFARTGEISLNQLHRVGAQGVILGHSEVGDEPEVINKKLLSILKKQQELKDSSFLNKITVLVGESWKEFDKNTPQKIAQLTKAKCDIIFKDIPKEFLSQTIVSYEPKWGSRGSGRDDMPPPEPELISACIKEMRTFFKEKYGIKPYFIYGGRSTPERTKEILADKNVDGLILGSACNTVKKTLDIAKTMQEVCGKRTKVLICNFKAYDLPDSYEKYFSKLSKLPDDFIVQLAPPYTDIRAVKFIIDNQLRSIEEVAKELGVKLKDKKSY